jgi:hypothetical protein
MIAGQPQRAGQIVMNGVPPGSYRLFVVDAANWPLLYDPAGLLKSYRNLAPLIVVAEGEQKSLAASVTPFPSQ